MSIDIQTIENVAKELDWGYRLSDDCKTVYLIYIGVYAYGETSPDAEKDFFHKRSEKVKRMMELLKGSKIENLHFTFRQILGRSSSIGHLLRMAKWFKSINIRMTVCVPEPTFTLLKELQLETIMSIEVVK